MDNTGLKILLSLTGLFLGGVTSWYGLHAAEVKDGNFWLAMMMAGLAPIAGYLIGFYQINPSNQPRTPEAIVRAVDSMAKPEESHAVLTAGAQTLLVAAEDRRQQVVVPAPPPLPPEPAKP